jgi:hypothetical protein
LGSRICASGQEVEELHAKLKLTPCPHCKQVGSLMKHGFLRGYDQDHHLHKAVRAARVFCSNRHRAVGCGRTFSVWTADKIKRLFLSADRLWEFLTDAVRTGNKLAAFRKLQSGLSDSAPYRIWKRFLQSQTAIRTALVGCCEPPRIECDHPAQVTLAHLQTAFQNHSLCPIAAFGATLQTFLL